MGFDFNNNTPIYIQIAELIKVKIVSGNYQPGERLPSVRDLAVELKANPNTVQRALSDLENTGLILTERTNGKFVTTDVAEIQNQKALYARMLAEDYLNRMDLVGFNKVEAAEILNKVEK
ncbi:MAG: GntR family transcriptional regulator [Clostridia bacterium]|nr:GntR family transcriptional regulator [Clostridia bacterium]